MIKDMKAYSIPGANNSYNRMASLKKGKKKVKSTKKK
jgi:hypothetical protein